MGLRCRTAGYHICQPTRRRLVYRAWAQLLFQDQVPGPDARPLERRRRPVPHLRSGQRYPALLPMPLHRPTIAGLGAENSAVGIWRALRIVSRPGLGACGRERSARRYSKSEAAHRRGAKRVLWKLSSAASDACRGHRLERSLEYAPSTGLPQPKQVLSEEPRGVVLPYLPRAARAVEPSRRRLRWALRELSRDCSSSPAGGREILYGLPYARGTGPSRTALYQPLDRHLLTAGRATAVAVTSRSKPPDAIKYQQRPAGRFPRAATPDS